MLKNVNLRSGGCSACNGTSGIRVLFLSKSADFKTLLLGLTIWHIDNRDSIDSPLYQECHDLFSSTPVALALVFYNYSFKPLIRFSKFNYLPRDDVKIIVD